VVLLGFDFSVRSKTVSQLPLGSAIFLRSDQGFSFHGDNFHGSSISPKTSQSFSIGEVKVPLEATIS